MDYRELLDIEQTKALGVDPDTLGRHSSKIVVIHCIICGAHKSLRYKMLRDGKGLCCSKECTQKLRSRSQKEAAKHRDPEKERKRLAAQKKVFEDPVRVAEITAKREKTNLATRGVKHACQDSSIREKMSKIAKSNYAENSSIVKKRQATNLEKYGHSNFLASAEGQKKIKIYNQQRFGTDFPFECAEFQKYARSRVYEKYNVDNVRQLPEFRNKLKEWCIENPDKSFCSKPEIEILTWIRAFYPSAYKYKSENHEIDIFIPEVNIGIEHNGLYYHDEDHIDWKYHLAKTLFFKEKGIRIIHIWEHEWRDRQRQVQSFLRSALQKNEHRIGARSCDFIWTSSCDQIAIASKFLDTYHIQGSPSQITHAIIGRHNNEVVTVAAFGPHHRNKGGWVLTRFCTKEDWTISGALTKISQIASKELKSDIISWADFRLSTGNGYEKAGWIFDELLRPDYFYHKNQRVISKQARQKKIVGTPEGMTEREHARIDGLKRVYDCGKIRYKYEFSQSKSTSKTANEAIRNSKDQCRTCRMLDKKKDPTIKSEQSYFKTLDPMLQELVLEQDTIDKKGYSVTLLSRGSIKKIIHKCDVCGLAKETPFKLFALRKNLSHPKCKVSKTQVTNLKKYGVTNTCNMPKLVTERFSEKEEEIENNLTKEGYEVIGIKHRPDTKSDIVVEFICPQNHKHQITWKAWKAGQRCGRCYGNNGKITYDLIKDAFTLEGYQLTTTDYEDNNTRLSYICPKGHVSETSWKIWERGHRCPKCCTNSTSQAEQEVRQIFSSYKPIKTRKIIPPKELDIYFPDHKVAIEYCDLYWHSSDKHERIGVSYHHKKRIDCLEKGVHLITLFEDEWKEHKEICISRINNALGVVGRKIYARQCEVKEVNKGKANTFFSRNHLQGAGGAEKVYGLYYNGDLVYALSLRKPTRHHVANKAIEIKRMAPALNTLVVGGASRLFKRVCQYAAERGYKEIISYCDKRWGNGGVYQKFGMTMVRETNYTPALTNGRVRKSIQGYSGKQIPKGWYKIYDCGHQVWSLDLWKQTQSNKSNTSVTD